MAKQTFTTGQVLTAAQMTSLQQTAMLGGDASVKVASYTLVAADAGTTVAMNSASTTTITVNSGLFAAGDTVFIQNRGAGVCTVTAGTATVASAGSLALPQNDAGILYFTSASAATFYDFIQVGATSPLTTKGDLYGFSSSDARIPIGATNGHVLTVDSSEALGLKWAAAAGGGADLLATLSLSGSSTASGTISSNYRQFQIFIKNGKFAAGVNMFTLRFNGDTGDNYSFNTFLAKNNGELSLTSSESASAIQMGQNEATMSDSRMFGALVFVNRPSDTDRIFVNGQTIGFDGPNRFANHFVGVYDNSAAITSVTIGASGSTMSGDCFIYGVN